ncbi:MAG TPA: Gfo/Idh/MocA family oxidoreductase [Phycisphaerales bacterium]|nr:Gfo/Idh/MocA family oxidoreductase [Phycisphaerales bacterium]
MSDFAFRTLAVSSRIFTQCEYGFAWVVFCRHEQAILERNAMSNGVLKMGMIGGGSGAFIGAVHRMAARLDGEAQLVAGCFSSTPEKAIASGQSLGIADARNYPTWQAMVEGEKKLPAGERVDFVTVVTPNATHFEIARGCVRNGFAVVCDKPMVVSSAEAKTLQDEVQRAKTIFAVTYNYSGYPMVKQARAMVRGGELGAIRTVQVEYHQGWLANKIEAHGQKQADWRTNPAMSGGAGAIGDIGSHAEQLLRYVTGFEIESLCADVSSFVEGRKVDDDASVLLRFKRTDGVQAKGVLRVSQVEVGWENDLRISVHGTKGSLEWRQEHCNELSVRMAGEPERMYRRGNEYLHGVASEAGRIPPGHPEGFIEAFANVYRNVFKAIRAVNTGADAMRAAEQFDFSGIADGAASVRFIERALESAKSSAKWVDA